MRAFLELISTSGWPPLSFIMDVDFRNASLFSQKTFKIYSLTFTGLQSEHHRGIFFMEKLYNWHVWLFLTMKMYLGSIRLNSAGPCAWTGPHVLNFMFSLAKIISLFRIWLWSCVCVYPSSIYFRFISFFRRGTLIPSMDFSERTENITKKIENETSLKTNSMRLLACRNNVRYPIYFPRIGLEKTNFLTLNFERD